MTEEPATEQPATRLRLDISYDGTDFGGWAKQPGIRTVQGELDAALATVLARYGEPPTITVAGRTDAGVHATGQVAHIDLTPTQFASLVSGNRGKVDGVTDGPAGLARSINGIAGTSGDLYVSRASVAPPGFDARFAPVWRRYEYRIADAVAQRNPLTRNHTVWYPAALDPATMNDAAHELLGLHDWAAYCRPRAGATTIRTLQEFSWQRGENGVLTATLRADAFCHSMVRALVGAAVSVGERKLEAQRLVGIRDEATRTSEFKVMPAKGLTLVEVGYPPADELAARVEQTRARRETLAD